MHNYENPFHHWYFLIFPTEHAFPITSTKTFKPQARENDQFAQKSLIKNPALRAFLTSGGERRAPGKEIQSRESVKMHKGLNQRKEQKPRFDCGALLNRKQAESLPHSMNSPGEARA